MEEDNTVYVGVDVAKAKHAIAVAEGSRAGKVRYLGKIEATPAAVPSFRTQIATMRPHRSRLTMVNTFPWKEHLVLPLQPLRGPLGNVNWSYVMLPSKALVAATLALSLSTSHAVGADVRIVGVSDRHILKTDEFRPTDIHASTCSLLLEGPIVSGDLARVQAAVTEIKQRRRSAGIDRFWKSYKLCLNSNGGSYDEGLRIAEYVLAEGISTVVPIGASCMSACALIFMAGGHYVEERIWIPSRFLSIRATLGFHAPYPAGLDDRTYTEEEVRLVYSSAIDAMQRLIQLGMGLNTRAELLPTALMVEMISKGPTELFIIENMYQARLANIIVVDASLPSSITKENMCYACINMFLPRSRGNFSAKPAPGCSAGVGLLVAQPQISKRGDEVWIKGFGGEGLGYCVLRVRGSSIEVHTFLVGGLDDKSDWYFRSLPPSFFLSPRAPFAFE